MVISLMSFDQIAGTAVVALQPPAGESVFTYTHSTMRITAPARGAIELDSVQTAQELHEALQRWVSLLSTFFVVAPEPRMSFEETIEKSASPPPGQIKFLYRVGGTRIEAQWDKATGRFKFKPRAAINWNIADFENFLQSFRRVFREAETF